MTNVPVFQVTFSGSYLAGNCYSFKFPADYNGVNLYRSAKSGKSYTCTFTTQVIGLTYSYVISLLRRVLHKGSVAKQHHLEKDKEGELGDK